MNTNNIVNYSSIYRFNRRWSRANILGQIDKATDSFTKSYDNGNAMGCKQYTLNQFVKKYQKLLKEKDKTITGFNVGEDAGQTTFHVYAH